MSRTVTSRSTPGWATTREKKTQSKQTRVIISKPYQLRTTLSLSLSQKSQCEGERERERTRTNPKTQDPSHINATATYSTHSADSCRHMGGGEGGSSTNAHYSRVHFLPTHREMRLTVPVLYSPKYPTDSGDATAPYPQDTTPPATVLSGPSSLSTVERSMEAPELRASVDLTKMAEEKVKRRSPRGHEWITNASPFKNRALNWAGSSSRQRSSRDGFSSSNAYWPWNYWGKEREHSVGPIMKMPLGSYPSA